MPALFWLALLAAFILNWVVGYFYYVRQGMGEVAAMIWPLMLIIEATGPSEPADRPQYRQISR